MFTAWLVHERKKKKKKKARGIFFELKTHARILPTLTADVKKRHCKHCSFCPCFHLPRKKKKKKDTFREEWSVGKLGEAGGQTGRQERVEGQLQPYRGFRPISVR